MANCALSTATVRWPWIILAVFLFMALPCEAASPGGFLDSSVDEFEAQGHEMFKLCRKLNVPCGEEFARGYQHWRHKKPALRLKNTTARNVLDEISRRNPGHRWVFQDGIVILEPTQRTYQDLLERRLARVSVHGRSSLDAALDVFRQAKLKIGFMTMGNPLYAHVDLELTDVTVREALNAIAKADGQVMWNFVPTDVGKGRGSFYMGSWRTKGFDLKGKFHQREITQNDTFLQ
ncbi:MAG: hypothetical protein HY924_02080 [Elusimicrobia bacterium]|nr:hypothetical protein [Elusimicrobiota bacterium]